MHQSGPTSISVINSAANWWKHEAEWFKNGNVPKNGERTFETIMGISKQNEYALSNVLASFSETKTISFIECIVPHIEQWTRELVSHMKLKMHNKALHSTIYKLGVLWSRCRSTLPQYA